MTEVDRQLAELGKPPADVPALLARALGQDRSQARLEQLLGELGAAAPKPAVASRPVPAPPAARPPSGPPAPASEMLPRSARPAPPQATAIVPPHAHDTVVDGPTLGLSLPSAEEGELDSDTAALLSGIAAPDAAAASPQDPDDDGEPELSLSAGASEPAPAPEASISVQPSGPPPAEPPGSFAAMFDLSDPPPPRVSAPAPSSMPASARTPEQAREDRRSSIKALLDQSLDPNDFPSTPPPPRVPAEAVVATVAPAAAEEDDFEMLVDEEVIELVDDELEIMDDDAS